MARTSRRCPDHVIALLQEFGHRLDMGDSPAELEAAFAAAVADDYGEKKGRELFLSMFRIGVARRAVTINGPVGSVQAADGGEVILHQPDQSQGKKMGDTYNVGQAGAAGPHAAAHDTTFNNAPALPPGVGLPDLAAELTKLREHLSGMPTTVDTCIAVGEVAKAEQAAATGDHGKVIALVKGFCQATLKIATDIGTKLVVEVAKAALTTPPPH